MALTIVLYAARVYGCAIMLTYQIALSFFGVAVLLALAPGPDNVFVLMQSIMAGRRAGMWVILGLCTGLVAHTFAVAVGLAAVFAASATAFTVLKLAGAIYLLYLAWGAFHSPADTVIRQGDVPDVSALALYRRGIIMNLSNPKVSLFFLAFLPQFTSPLRGSVALQTFSLGALFILASLLVFGGIAVFADTVGRYLKRKPGAQRLLNRLTAGVFVGLAIKLGLASR